MNPIRCTLALLGASLALCAAEPSPAAPPETSDAAGARRAVPAVLVTDLGDDIDDVWALALALRSPELDLRMVLTDYGDTVYRGRIAARYLELAGRTDVAVGIGVRQREQEGPQPTHGYELGRYPGPVHDDGVQALIDLAMKSQTPVTVIAVGPPPSLQAALAREPRIAGRLRLTGMYGSLREGYAEGSRPEPEWNVRAEPAAARAVLAAPWRDAVVTPLDTCGRVFLDGDRYARLVASPDPVTRALLADYRLWCPRVDFCPKEPGFTERRSSTLFDTVAVYLAFASDLLTIERAGIRVQDDGMTVIDASAPAVGWATAWKDLDGFRDLLVERLDGYASASAEPTR